MLTNDLAGVKLWLAICRAAEGLGAVSGQRDVIHRSGEPSKSQVGGRPWVVASGIPSFSDSRVRRTPLERAATVQALRQIATPFASRRPEQVLGNGNGSSAGNGNIVANGNSLNKDTPTTRRTPLGNGAVLGNGTSAPGEVEKAITVTFPNAFEDTPFSRRMCSLRVNLNKQRTLLSRAVNSANARLGRDVGPTMDVEYVYHGVPFRIQGHSDDVAVKIDHVSIAD